MNTKVIVITGTSSGIGYEMAQYFSNKNYKVFGLSRKVPKDALFTTISTNITNYKEVEETIKKILQQEKRIDVLINNAGKGMVGAAEDATKEEIQELFTLNVIGSIHTIKAVMPSFRVNGGGKIINISSIGSEMGLPFRGYYSASKAALDKITEAIRYEVNSFNIQVCSLHLGDVKTNIASHRINSVISKPYKEMFKRVYEGMNKHVDNGTNVEEIPVFIEKLIIKKDLKPHYYYGKFMQKLSVFLKKALPQRVFESLIKKYSKL